MRVTFDPIKSERNRAARGLPFSAAEEFDWSSMLLVPDDRFDYPEARYRATGFLHGQLHMLVFTPTWDGVRVISLRMASRKERRSWHESRIPI